MQYERVPRMHLALFIVLLVSIATTYAALQCRDEDNNPIDWYVLYKLPRSKKSSSSLIREGLAYLYIASNNVSKGWTLSSVSINGSQSIPGRTLQNLYDYSNLKEDSLLWVQYNDQPPNGHTTLEHGHTKGVVMSEAEGGFWLVHSVPHFPPVPDSGTKYSYPETGTHYGQSLLCISLNASQIDLVGIQLMYNEPKIYGSNVPENLEDKLPNLVAAAREKTVQSAPWYHHQEISSVGGQEFYSFAKAGKFNKELYFDWVAPTLETSLLVESWRNGAGTLPSSCNSTHTVENISSVNISAAHIQFATTHDHSKWAAADKDFSNGKDWICVGDINRMESQETRGGGTVCINHYKLWPAYRQVIDSTDPCPAY